MNAAERTPLSPELLVHHRDAFCSLQRLATNAIARGVVLRVLTPAIKVLEAHPSAAELHASMRRFHAALGIEHLIEPLCRQALTRLQRKFLTAREHFKNQCIGAVSGTSSREVDSEAAIIVRSHRQLRKTAAFLLRSEDFQLLYQEAGKVWRDRPFEFWTEFEKHLVHSFADLALCLEHSANDGKGAFEDTILS